MRFQVHHTGRLPDPYQHKHNIVDQLNNYEWDIALTKNKINWPHHPSKLSMHRNKWPETVILWGRQFIIMRKESETMFLYFVHTMITTDDKDLM